MPVKQGINILIMMMSPLYNDVLKKKGIWELFSKNNNGQFHYLQTISKEINELKLECIHENIKVLFEESDAKPLGCEFIIEIKNNVNLEISQVTIFDQLSSFLISKDRLNHPFFKKYKIKSNNELLLNSIQNDIELLDLLNNSEFSGLYAYTEKGFLKTRITSSYFVNSYDKLSTIYNINCRAIDHLIQF
jgi:predicted AlkP superfamily phosphohydrolase/phosphomutase